MMRAHPRKGAGGVLLHCVRIPDPYSDAFPLHPAQPLGDFPPARWSTLTADVRLFIKRATIAGWSQLDLYGCDRIDQAGLLLLNGDALVDLDAGRAISETSTGARLIYRRRPRQSGRGVTIFELAAASAHFAHLPAQHAKGVLSPGLVAEMASITHYNMRLPQNLGMLRKWRKRRSEAEIVEGLVLFNYHFRGARSRNGQQLPPETKRRRDLRMAGIRQLA